jgi:mannose-binding-like lectin 1
MGHLPWFPPPFIRDAAAHMASGTQVFYLPVGTQHHFLELDQILSLLQKDLRGLVVRKK